MFVCLYVCMFVYLYVFLFECLYVCMFICLNVYMFICLYVYMFVCMFVCLSVYMFVYFQHLGSDLITLDVYTENKTPNDFNSKKKYYLEIMKYLQMKRWAKQIKKKEKSTISKKMYKLLKEGVY